MESFSFRPGYSSTLVFGAANVLRYKQTNSTLRKSVCLQRKKGKKANFKPSFFLSNFYHRDNVQKKLSKGIAILEKMSSHHFYTRTKPSKNQLRVKSI